MRILAIHVVREDDYLEDVRVNRFASTLQSATAVNETKKKQRTSPRRRRPALQRRQT